MAIVTRYNGDASGVPGVDVGYKGAYTAGTIVATGIGKRISALRIAQAGVDLSGELGVGGAVEAILQVVATNATILAFQCESGAGGALSVLVEGNSWLTETALRDAVRALGATVGVGPVSVTTATATWAQGLKLAA